ncbi:MAG TPA: alcohol dehydrogenase catalytic domain-containing protein [Solirubrobacteraceae bacterium]|nr:alcohol dehydrogenase catalytic domain-containing protein [Solirubrobacteraceae bacterium]
MRAAVTESVGSMVVRDRPEPGAPGAGEVVIHPEAIGICGSDYHFFAGELSEEAGGSQFPRVLGHEVGATIVAAGSDCRPELVPGQRVAVWPLQVCGHCYPCSVGRANNCENFRLVGIHTDGGMQELLSIGQDQLFPIDGPAAVAAMAEPVSIAVRAANRARISPGEHVVVLGAGPIGQCICLAARERGAEVLVIDLQESRLGLSQEMGAQTLVWTDAADSVAFARRWAGPSGPPVVIDATGASAAVSAMIEMVSHAGRAVQVGMSGDTITLRLGSLTEKELDLLGVCCCGTGEYAEAVALVERHAGIVGRMISHEFALEQAPEAIRFAMSNPTKVMKVVIRGE